MSTSEGHSAAAPKAGPKAGSRGTPKGTPQVTPKAAQTAKTPVPNGQRPNARSAGDRVESVSSVKFLTVAEVAATMRVSKMTVYRMVHSGELAAVRVGRSFRVREKAVHEYLERAFIEAG
jgi:excisionase family DNA binding protein